MKIDEWIYFVAAQNAPQTKINKTLLLKQSCKTNLIITINIKQFYFLPLYKIKIHALLYLRSDSA